MEIVGRVITPPPVSLDPPMVVDCLSIFSSVVQVRQNVYAIKYLKERGNRRIKYFFG